MLQGQELLVLVAPFCYHTQVGESSVCSRLHKAGCFQQACSWPSKPLPRAHFPLPRRHVSSQLPGSNIFAIVDLLVTTPRSRLGSWRHIHPWRREAEPAFWVCITLQSSLPFQQPVSFHPATAFAAPYYRSVPPAQLPSSLECSGGVPRRLPSMVTIHHLFFLPFQ